MLSVTVNNEATPFIERMRCIQHHTVFVAKIRSRMPHGRSHSPLPFQRVVRRAGLSPAEVTMYALRHSSIVRQLLRGIPARIVAVNHDTSITMLERTYSRHITEHSDALTREALLDLA
jgi:hypothetical protein